MKYLRIILAVCLMAAVAAAPALASDAFHVKYRHENVSTDGITRSGDLLLNVYNTSGGSLQDLEAWVDGPNNVTYDNRRIYLGTLADGQQIEVLDAFSVPEDMVGSETAEDEIEWTLEFTDASGQRVTADVLGEKVQ